MAKLILVRHGKSVYNQENRFTGWTDVDLAPEGVKEAQKAGEIICKNNLRIDICFSSYLKRAIRTAWTILEATDSMAVDFLHGWKLNERHYGDWQGKNKAEMKSKMDAASYKKIHRGFDIRPPLLDEDDERHPRFAPKYQKIDIDRLPAGESLKDTEQRAVNYYYEAIVPRLMLDENVMVAAHGNSLRALMKHIEQIPVDAIGKLEIPTARPYVYEFDGVLNLLTHDILK